MELRDVSESIRVGCAAGWKDMAKQICWWGCRPKGIQVGHHVCEHCRNHKHSETKANPNIRVRSVLLWPRTTLTATSLTVIAILRLPRLMAVLRVEIQTFPLAFSTLLARGVEVPTVTDAVLLAKYCPFLRVCPADQSFPALRVLP
eukprot:2912551-Rhodomonas_salina.1